MKKLASIWRDFEQENTGICLATHNGRQHPVLVPPSTFVPHYATAINVIHRGRCYRGATPSWNHAHQLANL